jgi:hypothetical protein
VPCAYVCMYVYMNVCMCVCVGAAVVAADVVSVCLCGLWFPMTITQGWSHDGPNSWPNDSVANLCNCQSP